MAVVAVQDAWPTDTDGALSEEHHLLLWSDIKLAQMHIVEPLLSLHYKPKHVPKFETIVMISFPTLEDSEQMESNIRVHFCTRKE